MTLHMYGLIDDAWVTLSDSRTTKEAQDGQRALVSDATVKYLTHPEDQTDWSPGDFAAIVLTHGRGEFARSNEAGVDAAVDVLRSGLGADGAPQINSLTELVDALWQPVASRWYRCAKCTAVRDDLFEMYTPDELSEYLAAGRPASEFMCMEDHVALGIVAVGINSSDGATCVVREWGREDQLITLADREFRTAGALDGSHSLSGCQNEVLGQLEALFRRHADAAHECQASMGGGEGPIGGLLHTWLLSPTGGFHQHPSLRLTSGPS